MSLRSFLDSMEKQGQIFHIKDRASTKHEISSVMNAFPNGLVLFFENVEGYPIKVVVFLN